MTETDIQPGPDTVGPPAKRRRRYWLVLLLAILLFPAVVTLLLRWVPIPTTPFMVVTAHGNNADIVRDWVPLEQISVQLQQAVVASEDTKFCSHSGFDWDAIEKAQDQNERGGQLRGASTLSMQTAKNVFLWPDRSWLRKGLEAGFTVLIEALWPKRRILEMYLNVAEWGPSIYGAEAAAQYHFRTSAAQLSRQQAALLAAALPSPIKSNPGNPSAYLRNQAKIIERRMAPLPCL